MPNTVRPGIDDADLRLALADKDAETLIARTWLSQDETSGWDELRARIAITTRPVFPLQGRDVTALGIPPGPRVGEVLAAVRVWWRQGSCIANLDACVAKAKSYIG